MIENIREHLEEIEKRELSWAAALSSQSKGRMREEEPCSIRPAFQHDRDRIVHTKAFRRLGDKTQVFLSPKGSNYSNRLTHTLEVSQIGRTVAKALLLNESLTEAIGLGHDLGHTPFGHSGERALDRILKLKMKNGFRHEQQSLRVVDFLAKNGQGLNLTYEVRNGIVLHSKGKGLLIKKTGIPETLEGQIIRFADIIAYLNHDIDDAVRGGFLDIKDVPHKDILGERGSQRINAMTTDLIYNSYEAISAKEKIIRFSDKMVGIIGDLREFMFKNVYELPAIRKEFDKAEHIIRALFDHFSENYDTIVNSNFIPISEDKETTIADFIASLTDSYAIHLYNTFFIPKTLKFPDI